MPKKNRPTPKTPRTRPSHTAPDEQPTGTDPVPVATSRHNPPVHPAWHPGRSPGRIVLQQAFVGADSAASYAPALHPTRPRSTHPYCCASRPCAIPSPIPTFWTPRHLCLLIVFPLQLLTVAPSSLRNPLRTPHHPHHP